MQLAGCHAVLADPERTGSEPDESALCSVGHGGIREISPVRKQIWDLHPCCAATRPDAAAHAALEDLLACLGAPDTERRRKAVPPRTVLAEIDLQVDDCALIFDVEARDCGAVVAGVGARGHGQRSHSEECRSSPQRQRSTTGASRPASSAEHVRPSWLFERFSAIHPVSTRLAHHYPPPILGTSSRPPAVGTDVDYNLTVPWPDNLCHLDYWLVLVSVHQEGLAATVPGSVTSHLAVVGQRSLETPEESPRCHPREQDASALADV